MKTAAMFPGVGSQYTGMFEYLCLNSTWLKKRFDEASLYINEDLFEICLNSKYNKKLNQLKYAQIALFVLEVGLYEHFSNEEGFCPDILLGYSLGEYTALCCAGAMSFKTGIELVEKRGELLTSFEKINNGGMLWVLNMPFDQVGRICYEKQLQGLNIYLSAYLSNDNTAVSGDVISLKICTEVFEKLGALVVPVSVSGAFHSELIKKTAKQFKNIISSISFSPLQIPVISNCSATLYQTNQILENLYSQLFNPLKWFQSIKYLEKLGVKEIVEIGPKNVLTYLLQKMNTPIIVNSIDTVG